jgi:ABC-type Zn uptake system ZnuABC Zn-binding protein ZnuA
MKEKFSSTLPLDLIQRIATNCWKLVIGNLKLVIDFGKWKGVTMKRILFLTITMLLLLNISLQAKIKVVTTTTDLAAIVKEIGKDQVEVKSIAKGYQDPHYVEAKPSYMRLLNKADLLVYVGLQLEISWLPLLIQGARNSDILPGNTGNLNASMGIHVLEVPEGEVDRTMGDIHPEGNPHYWLDPRNGIQIARTIAKRLKSLQPDQATYFEENLEYFTNSHQEKIQSWEKEMTPYRGLEIVCEHKQWEYLTNWLDLKIVGLVEDRPGIPPSPKHTAQLITQMRERKVPLLLNAVFYDPNIPSKVAKRGGARFLILPTSVEGEEGIESYLDLFDRIISLFKEGIRK